MRRSIGFGVTHLVVWLGACAPQDAVVSSNQARFDDYPKVLFSAVESVCSDPADTFSRPAQDMVECRSFLGPEATAAIIFRYDGTIDDLPQLVMSFRAREDTPGYLVDYDAYLRVPQKSGATLKVVQQSPTISRHINAVMRRAGGVPQ